MCLSVFDTCRLSSKEKCSEWGNVLDQKENDWRIEMRWLGRFRNEELVRKKLASSLPIW